MRYAIVIERTESNFSAYVPDLPGCVTTGARLLRSKWESVRRSRCTSMASGKTARKSRSRRVRLSTSRLRHSDHALALR